MLDEQGQKIEKSMCIVLAQFEWSCADGDDAIDAGQMRRSASRDYDHIPDDATRARFLAYQTKRKAELRDAGLGFADLMSTIWSEWKAAEQNMKQITAESQSCLSSTTASASGPGAPYLSLAR
jgi:hypothetical protein